MRPDRGEFGVFHHGGKFEKPPEQRGPARVEALVAQTFGVETILPTQLRARHRAADTGTHALLARLLLLALVDAGWTLDPCTTGWHRVAPRQPRRWHGPRLLAQRWLCGELDAEVAVPIGWVCDVLGLDAGVLAAAVRARTGRQPAARGSPRREGADCLSSIIRYGNRPRQAGTRS
jgi:hypothetical protein